MDMSVFQRIGNGFSSSAAEWFSSMEGIGNHAFIPGLGGPAGGSAALFAMNPELAAGMMALQFAAPLLRQFLDMLPNPERTENGKDTPGSPGVHGARHQRSTGAADAQNEIDRILASSLPLEEKIILIAGLVSESVGGQLEDLLQQQGQMAKKMDGSGATGGTSGSAQFQNLENRIQLLVQRLNRMQTLSSNLLQSLHTTQRAVLANIRV